MSSEKMRFSGPESDYYKTPDSEGLERLKGFPIRWDWFPQGSFQVV